MFGRAMMAAGWHVAADHLADRLGPCPRQISERPRCSLLRDRDTFDEVERWRPLSDLKDFRAPRHRVSFSPEAVGCAVLRRGARPRRAVQVRDYRHHADGRLPDAR
jgi:hypothetical protein